MGSLCSLDVSSRLRSKNTLCPSQFQGSCSTELKIKHQFSLMNYHYGDITCASWDVKSLATWQFVQECVEAYHKENTSSALQGIHDGNPPLTGEFHLCGLLVGKHFLVIMPSCQVSCSTELIMKRQFWTRLLQILVKLTRNCSKLRKIHSGQGHTSLPTDFSSEFKLV